MVSAPGSTKTLNVLLGRSGTEDSFAQLAEGLRSEGFKVVEEKSSPVGAHDTGDAVKHSLRGIDVVLLVVHKGDGIGEVSPPFDRVLQDAKLIEQSIGGGKVLLLVEETVDGLPDTGLSHIRFPTSRADMILQDVVNKIGPDVPAPTSRRRDLHARVPLSEQARSKALRVPWVLVFVVLVSAAIPLAVALNSFRGGGGPELATMSGVADALAQPDSSASLGLDSAAGATADTEDAAPAGSVVADAPASPAAVGGTNALLPATCEVDLRKNSLLDNALACDGVGQLVLEGLAGPWHNEIGAVAVADGVVAALHMEVRADGTTNGPAIIELASGAAVSVDPVDSAFGAEKLTARFSANNQHVHFFRNTDGSGELVTLTFILDQ
ncbi:MAG: hypothetical protein ACRBK7_03100 [Acidimicrobiales bacterium]